MEPTKAKLPNGSRFEGRCGFLRELASQGSRRIYQARQLSPRRDDLARLVRRPRATRRGLQDPRPVYDGFAEGFETAGLTYTRALLEGRS